MGAWGVGIFHDDTACALRDLYTELASLGLAPPRILEELEREFGRDDGIGESTFWLALALTQHKIGRLDQAVKSRAVQFIESGRALADWAELTEPDDPSIGKRLKQLDKARATLDAPQKKLKSLKPSTELKARIDRTYVDYPWRKDGLYAYRFGDSAYAVFAASAVGPAPQQRHYVTTPKGYALAPRPVLTQAILLLLDYRGDKPPSPAQARKLLPYVRPSTKTERNEVLEGVEASRTVWAEGAMQSFSDFTRESRSLLSALPERLIPFTQVRLYVVAESRWVAPRLSSDCRV